MFTSSFNLLSLDAASRNTSTGLLGAVFRSARHCYSLVGIPPFGLLRPTDEDRDEVSLRLSFSSISPIAPLIQLRLLNHSHRLGKIESSCDEISAGQRNAEAIRYNSRAYKNSSRLKPIVAKMFPDEFLATQESHHLFPQIFIQFKKLRRSRMLLIPHFNHEAAILIPQHSRRRTRSAPILRS